MGPVCAPMVKPQVIPALPWNWGSWIGGCSRPCPPGPQPPSPSMLCLQLGVMWGPTQPRTGFAGQPAVLAQGLGRAQERSAGGGPWWTHPNTQCVLSWPFALVPTQTPRLAHAFCHRSARLRPRPRGPAELRLYGLQSPKVRGSLATCTGQATGGRVTRVPHCSLPACPGNACVPPLPGPGPVCCTEQGLVVARGLPRLWGAGAYAGAPRGGRA